MITIERAEELAGPRDTWAWRCHEVSTALAPHVDGKVRRGLYLGETVQPVYQHSWVELPDGRILDATRHAFCGGEPDIWIGQDSAKVYDIGACSRRVGVPFPEDYEYEGDLIYLGDYLYGDEDEDEEQDAAYSPVLDYLDGVIGKPRGYVASAGLTPQQLAWIANLPIVESETTPDTLARWWVAEVYETISAAGFRAFIPIDRLVWILYGGDYEKAKT